VDSQATWFMPTRIPIALFIAGGFLERTLEAASKKKNVGSNGQEKQRSEERWKQRLNFPLIGATFGAVPLRPAPKNSSA
jgi:hypothetical protein